MVNIYDTANQLAKDLKETQEYLDLAKAVKAIEEDPTSKDLFKRMDEVQAKLMRAQQMGQEITDQDAEEYGKLAHEAQSNANITNLFEAEQKVHGMLDEIQRIYSAQLNDLYENIRNKDLYKDLI
ncbi:hypothetical protein FC52_GL000018 [Lactobacillus pasteurii DSM 23907 = CRBIP 24.76]|uniref:UPF0342 protein BN53_06940 n=1 Tax=Lactobacillus pasteurii DSM 23907 = CRBIP 24.76 TaxID=1423790 RepID=I7LEJ0_9LACO|nr:YlbF family regulator [Lactobacillus pasteurii]KRK08325.1 hypothetical protein FC52_GL000018 [Lactobacillus pasteurii DSM 23907 = CRBIP 24.76]TDG75503.1 hypothetical protein C5L33_000388 [Lactobacillus pasteurii]CCI85818.1 UPF0342 protein LBHH_0508 [Lactobacillus pasteurii DSM 23907 = CRBIP 24.76]